MKDVQHYSDMDIQQYVDNTFVGDIQSLEQHIKNCARCTRMATAYSRIANFVLMEYPEDQIEIKLELLLPQHNTPPKKSIQTLGDKILYLFLGMISLSITAIVATSLSISDINIFPLLVILFFMISHGFISLKEFLILKTRLPVESKLL